VNLMQVSVTTDQSTRSHHNKDVCRNLRTDTEGMLSVLFIGENSVSVAKSAFLVYFPFLKKCENRCEIPLCSLSTS
jgi:hypothetical protein